MQIGIYIVENEEYPIYLENGVYSIDLGDKVEVFTKLYIAQIIANYWSDDSNTFTTEKDGDLYKAEIFIPIYDWIFVTLFYFDKDEQIAQKKVKEMFDDFCDYNKKYEENLERNRKAFMNKVHRFGFINIDDHEIKPNYSKLNFVQFPDGDDEFYILAINAGMKNKSFARGQIFGYKQNIISAGKKTHRLACGMNC